MTSFVIYTDLVRIQGNYNERITDNNIQYFRDLKLWENNFARKKTCTSNIYDLQYGLLQTGEKLINRKDIAEALLKRGVLRQVRAIQISSNIKFVSIGFDTTSTMETFCQESLTLQDNIQAIFLPDFRKKPRRIYKMYTFVSFLNVPSEADEDLLTDFVEQFADVEGSPRYPKENSGDIKHKTGTRVYRVSNIVTPIPRYNKIFGRTIKCIYMGQPQDDDD